MRKKRNIQILSLVVAAALFLAGCGNQIPDMTKEQSEAIGEYAAIQLMKFDANNRSRLVARSVVEAADAREPIPTMMPIATKAPESDSGKDSSDAPEQTSEPEVLGTIEGVASFLGLPQGIAMICSGMSVTDRYTDPEDNYFSLEPSAGKKLLVLNFVLYNEGTQTQRVDLLRMNVKYRAIINNDYTQSVMTAMLLNYLTTYQGEIGPGSGADVVLLVEIDDEYDGAIQSIKLHFKKDSEDYTIQVL